MLMFSGIQSLPMDHADLVPHLARLLDREKPRSADRAQLRHWLGWLLIRESLLEEHVRWLQSPEIRERRPDELALDEFPFAEILDRGLEMIDDETATALLFSPSLLHLLREQIQERILAAKDPGAAEIWLDLMSEIGGQEMDEKGTQPSKKTPKSPDPRG